MEYLVVAVLLYFILRTASNLIALLGGRKGASPEQESSDSSRGLDWEGPSPRQQTGAAWDEPTFWGRDIEDATWHDVDDEARHRRSATH